MANSNFVVECLQQNFLYVSSITELMVSEATSILYCDRRYSFLYAQDNYITFNKHVE